MSETTKETLNEMLRKLNAKIEHAAAMQTKLAEANDFAWKAHNFYRNEFEAMRDDVRKALRELG